MNQKAPPNALDLVRYFSELNQVTAMDRSFPISVDLENAHGRGKVCKSLRSAGQDERG